MRKAKLKFADCLHTVLPATAYIMKVEVAYPEHQYPHWFWEISVFTIFWPEKMPLSAADKSMKISEHEILFILLRSSSNDIPRYVELSMCQTQCKSALKTMAFAHFHWKSSMFQIGLSVTRGVYDKDHMSELWIKNRNERDLCSCEVT